MGEDGRIPGVAVKCVEIWRNTDGEGSSSGKKRNGKQTFSQIHSHNRIAFTLIIVYIYLTSNSRNGFIITIVPVLIMAVWCLKKEKMDVGTTYGMLCGSMANPMALTYANDCVEGDTTTVSYATVYPLGMFLRVVIIQVLLLFLI